MVREYTPPEIIEIPLNEELYFLAGPIQGAPDWQRAASGLIAVSANDHANIHIANPRRDYIDGSFEYEAQVDWEKANLTRAAKCGAALFWFAAQDHSLPYEEGRAYAQTTRVEFGRYIGWRDLRPHIRMSIGIEPGYKGSERYIRHCSKEQKQPVYTTLEDACEKLMRIK